VVLAVILVLISGLMRVTRDKGLPSRAKAAAAAEHDAAQPIPVRRST